MLGEMTQKAFTKVYVLMILNLLFWLFSLIGLFILGVGPALRTVTELFLNHQYNYHTYRFSEAWKIYKKYFWIANGYFYTYASVFCFLVYDLYLTSQLKNAWFLPIDFILAFLLLVTVVTGLYALIISSNFEINYVNTIKLATMRFFMDFKSLLKLLAGLVLISALTKFWPGFLLFLTISSVIVWGHYVLKAWLSDLSEQLGVE